MGAGLCLRGLAPRAPAARPLSLHGGPQTARGPGERRGRAVAPRSPARGRQPSSCTTEATTCRPHVEMRLGPWGARRSPPAAVVFPVTPCAHRGPSPGLLGESLGGRCPPGGSEGRGATREPAPTPCPAHVSSRSSASIPGRPRGTLVWDPGPGPAWTPVPACPHPLPAAILPLTVDHRLLPPDLCPSRKVGPFFVTVSQSRRENLVSRVLLWLWSEEQARPTRLRCLPRTQLASPPKEGEPSVMPPCRCHRPPHALSFCFVFQGKEALSARVSGLISLIAP